MSGLQIRPVQMDNAHVEIEVALPGDLGVITLKHDAPAGGHTLNASPYYTEMLDAVAALAAKKDIHNTLQKFANRPRLLGVQMPG